LSLTTTQDKWLHKLLDLISWCAMFCDWSVEVVRTEPQELFLHHIVNHALKLNQLWTQMSITRQTQRTIIDKLLNRLVTQYAAMS